MCQEKLPMKDVLDLFRQKFELECSERRIARSLDLSRATVANYLRRFTAAGLTWPLPQEMDHAALEKRLFPAGPVADTPAIRAVPDFSYLHGELKRQGVTLMTLWEEYRQALASGEEGYSYSRFCELYRDFAKTLAISMRQHHVAGDKMFVDYSGDKIDIMISTLTGEMKSAEIFVAVLGASNYTYAEATWTQTSCDWIHSHIRALKFFGGVTALIVPDNLASGVTKPNFYEPTINRAYQDFASYYDTVILPARVRRAKDKAKAEIGVRLAQIWILAKLRNRVTPNGHRRASSGGGKISRGKSARFAAASWKVKSTPSTDFAPALASSAWRRNLGAIVSSMRASGPWLCGIPPTAPF